MEERIALRSSVYRGYNGDTEACGQESRGQEDSSSDVESPVGSGAVEKDRWTLGRVVSLGTLGTVACLALCEAQRKAVSGSPTMKPVTDNPTRPIAISSTPRVAIEPPAQSTKRFPLVQSRTKEIIVQDDGRGYHPEFWNDDDVQLFNNCYNYATNRRTDSLAEPGRGGGYYSPVYKDMSCDIIGKRARSDRLKPHSCKEPCPGGDIHVFLSVARGFDFHWYREHQELKKWSHKRGSLPVSDTDFSGKIIEDPTSADRGEYSEACGCFCVPDDAQIVGL